MDQSIKQKIAGKIYPLKAANPQMEQMMRIAAEDVNRTLAKLNERYPDTPLEDKLVFVAIQEAVAKLHTAKKYESLNNDVSSLSSELATYLAEIEKD